MACINMYNSGQEHHHQGGIPMSPRISFSNDFVVEQAAAISSVPKLSPSPGDPDFEFSVGSRPMMAADELFFKGRLVPLREHCIMPRTTTLRDELLAGDEDDADVWGSTSRPMKSIKWKELLGLKKQGGHYGNKKQEVKSITEGGTCRVEEGGKTILQEED
ncbi:hypothetical protein IHE45_19G043500 [Dioscorea alata]|uniref:Uncharacterized protein n=1 Tax=Dioscorea alata TaxID=55571 RepID=A0ACB7TXR9_DIOAL|nr:hypothetical protein IHE45_19G043500 [Dioscorea alata]